VVQLNQQQLNDAADIAIAEFAFATGQPLRLVDDFFAREAFKKVAAAGPSRKQLTRKRLKEQLLPEVRKRVAREQQEAINLNKEKYGLSIVSDGWTDANKKPLLNILKVSPDGEFFVEAIDTSGETKSMQYIADQVARHINADVDCIVMDGACAGAVEILRERFPWLSGVVCTTHSLDLLMHDLGKMDFAAEPLAKAAKLVRFINNHHKTKALFAELSDVVLLSPAPTRFGYNYIMVERLLRCKDAIRKLVASAEYDTWVKAQRGDIKNDAKYVDAHTLLMHACSTCLLLYSTQA
jgi:hypothetical protein